MFDDYITFHDVLIKICYSKTYPDLLEKEDDVNKLVESIELDTVSIMVLDTSTRRLLTYNTFSGNAEKIGQGFYKDSVAKLNKSPNLRPMTEKEYQLYHQHKNKRDTLINHTQYTYLAAYHDTDSVTIYWIYSTIGPIITTFYLNGIPPFLFYQGFCGLIIEDTENNTDWQWMATQFTPCTKEEINICTQLRANTLDYLRKDNN